jgi:SAM-dependent methyltransferase
MAPQVRRRDERAIGDPVNAHVTLGALGESGCVICGGRVITSDSGAAAPPTFFRCADCGHAFKVVPADTSIVDLNTQVVTREQSTSAKWVLERLPQGISGSKSIDVLDVGCWDGSVLAGLPAAWRRMGIEPQPTAAERARMAGLDVATTTLEDLDTQKRAYDLILMLDVLEHLADPMNALAKANYLLRPGGTFAALTGDANSLAARQFGKNWYYVHYPDHVSFFTHRSLRDALTRADFVRVQVEHTAHPMSSHLVDVLRVVRRMGSAARNPRGEGTTGLPIGPNLPTLSRLVRGRDHLWAVAVKRNQSIEPDSLNGPKSPTVPPARRD